MHIESFKAANLFESGCIIRRYSSWGWLTGKLVRTFSRCSSRMVDRAFGFISQCLFFVAHVSVIQSVKVSTNIRHGKADLIHARWGKRRGSQSCRQHLRFQWICRKMCKADPTGAAGPCSHRRAASLQGGLIPREERQAAPLKSNYGTRLAPRWLMLLHVSDAFCSRPVYRSVKAAV